MTRSPANAADPIAVDTSVAVPVPVATHAAHGLVADWARGRTLALSGHAAIETYSVLTRLPGDLRLPAEDARLLLGERFAESVHPDASALSDLPRRFADAGVAGGAVYDALVGFAALDSGRTLATRDHRARATYEAIGVQVELVA